MTTGVERPIGAALGGALSAILFVLLLVLPRPTIGCDLFDLAALIVALGSPIAVLLGWRFAPRVSDRACKKPRCDRGFRCAGELRLVAAARLGG
jgi:hypothetical protein